MAKVHHGVSLEAALERLEQAHDSLLGLGNLSESLFNFTTLDDGTSSLVPHAGTPWGVKASQGQRPNMEDAYSVQMPQHACPTQGGCTQEAPAQTAPVPHPGSPAAQEGVASPAPQDTISAPPIPEDLAVLSVFDGHGGTEVAEHCRDKLHKHFAASLSQHRTAAASHQGKGQEEPDSDGSQPGTQFGPSYSDSPTTLLSAMVRNMERNHPVYPPEHVTDALRVAFHKTDTELAGTDAGEYVGATAVVAVVGRHHIWIAHCGDSRAVIQRNGEAEALTRDHKPDREDEAARIKGQGGRIVFTSGSHRVMGMLAMSRAIGDHFLRPYVIAEPEVTCVERTLQDEVLVLATDGLWDVFNCKEATTLAQRCITRSKERGMSRHGACRVAASVLTKVALERGSRDNITVIVVDVSIAAAPTQPQPHQPHQATAAVHPPAVAPQASTAGAAPGASAPSGSRLRGHVSDAEALTGSGRSAHHSTSRQPQVGTAAGVEPCAHSVPSTSTSTAGGSSGGAAVSTDTTGFGTSTKLQLDGSAPGIAGGSHGAGAKLQLDKSAPHAPGGVSRQAGTGSSGAGDEPQASAGPSGGGDAGRQRGGDSSGEGKVAGSSAGSKGGSGTGGSKGGSGGNPGMGPRTQSFSVTTCTWVKSGSSTNVTGIGTQGGQQQQQQGMPTCSSSNALSKDFDSRSMDRQLSAPSSQRQSATASTMEDPSSSRHSNTIGGAAAAQGGGAGQFSRSSHDLHCSLQQPSGTQSPSSPKASVMLHGAPHRLAQGSAAPAPSALIRALQSEQQAQRFLPPMAPVAGGRVQVDGGEVGAGLAGARNGSENGAHAAVSAARRGRVAVKRPGSGGPAGSHGTGGGAGPIHPMMQPILQSGSSDPDVAGIISKGSSGGTGAAATGMDAAGGKAGAAAELDGGSRAFKTM